MTAIKEKLVASLGAVGYIIYCVISIVLTFAPLLVLNFPFWVDFIIITLVTLIPMFGNLIGLVFWIWAFFVAIQNPTDIASIIYFVAFAIYVITTLLPLALSLFTALFSNRR